MGVEEFQGVRWFNKELIRTVGDGVNTFFWKDPWVSNVPLMVAFPRLFSLSTAHDGRVDEFYVTNPAGGRWTLGWRRELFEWENDLLTSLLMRLEGVARGVGVDSWVWKPDKAGMFTVKSCFLLLQNLCLLNGVLNREEEVIFRENWRGKAPGKVLAFSWTLLLDRIPPKVNLDKRRLMETDESRRCVFCDGEDELTVHLFLHCDIVSKVWREVMRWLNFNFIILPNLFIHTFCRTREVRSKLLRKGVWLIWHAVVWPFGWCGSLEIIGSLITLVLGWKRWWTKLRYYHGIGVRLD